LAGGSGEGDPRWATVGDPRLLDEQREQAGDGGGLTGAGAAGEDGRPLPGGGEGGGPLLGVPLAGEEPLGPCRQRRLVDRRRRELQPSDQVVADLALLAVVAIEVEQPAV